MVALIPHSSVRSFDGGKNADDDNSCHLKGKDNVTNVVVHFNSMHYFSFSRGPSGREIKNRLSIEESIPADMIIIQINGRLVGDQEILVDIDGVAPAAAIVVRATIANGLAGGKGGFGAMLRALAKQSGTKKTTDFGACRDLSGRLFS